MLLLSGIVEEDAGVCSTWPSSGYGRTAERAKEREKSLLCPCVFLKRVRRMPCACTLNTSCITQRDCLPLARRVESRSKRGESTHVLYGLGCRGRALPLSKKTRELSSPPRMPGRKTRVQFQGKRFKKFLAFFLFNELLFIRSGAVTPQRSQDTRPLHGLLPHADAAPSPPFCILSPPAAFFFFKSMIPLHCG